MGRILFVLALTVITTQCTVIKNEELAHKRVARSSCVDCDDWPPPPPGPPRPRYLLPYPRYLDYPPPPPPPPPRPFYYPHLPRPPGPPPPPFGRQHWHRVKNYSDENDDDDGDYSDSASAVSGVTGQNTGKAISIASIGINGDGSSKYTASTGSQYASKGGQSSETFKSQTSGSGSDGQQNSNAQTATNIQTTNTGKLSGAGSSATSSSQSTGLNALSNQESAQSASSSNSQSSQTGSASSAASNVQSSLDHNSQTTRGSQAQASDQPSLSPSTIPESSSAVGGSSSKSLNDLSSKLNQQSSNNFGRYSSEGLDIQSSVLGRHFSVGSSAVSNSQLSSDTASTAGSINNVGQFVGSNTKSSSFAGSSSADSNAQSVTGQGSKDLGILNTGFNQDDQTSKRLNIQSSKDLGGSSAESQPSSLRKLISQGYDSVSSNNGGIIGQFPSGYDIISDNSNAQSSGSHHTSGKFNKESSNNSGGSSFASVNTHSSDNSFENQSPVDMKPLHSDNFNDSPSVSSSSESAVGSRPSKNIDNQFSKNIGGLSLESSTSDTSKFQPAGFHPNPLSGFNNQHFESSSKLSNEVSNSQSQSSSSSHKFSTSSNRQYSSNGGIPFTNSNTPFGLGGQSGGVSGSEATNAQFGVLNHHNHGSILDQSSENISGSSSKVLGQFSSEPASQTSENFDNLQSANPETHPNDQIDKPSSNLYSQSINSFDSSHGQPSDILPTDNQNHIPLFGPTGEKHSENSAQGAQELKSQVYEYHKGGNAGSIENLQQTSSSEPDWDHSSPATDLSGLTASGLRNSLAKLKLVGSKNTGSIFNSSLEKPKSDSSYFVSQPSAYYNGQSINNFHGSGQFSDVKEQSPHKFGSISSHETQSSSGIGPSYAPNIQPINIDSGLYTDNQPNFGIQSSISHKNTKGFDVNSSSVNTQSSNSFVSSSSHDSNIHSFSIGDEMCVCGPRNSALFTAMSKSGALNGFDGQFTGSTGPNIGDIQTSGGSLENKADAQSANDQTEYKETHYSLLNADGNVAGYGVQFQNPNLDNGNRKEPIDPVEMTASLDVSNNDGFKSTATHEPPPQPISSTPPSRLLLPPLGSSPPTIPNLPASISGANTPARSVPEKLSNNDQRKEDFESQHYEYHGDNNPALYTDQQQMPVIGGFGSGFGGNTRSESDFTSSNSRGDNGFGNSGSINSGRNFGTKSSSSESYLTSSNSRGDGFGGHGSINAQGFPNGYVSGYFDTQGSQGARTPSGGSSYALSNAQSKNRDAFALSVGL